MQAQPVSNWMIVADRPGDYGPTVRKVENCINRNTECKVRNLIIEHKDNSLVNIKIRFTDFLHGLPTFFRYFKDTFPQIYFENQTIYIEFNRLDKDLSELNDILNGINLFEPIMPHIAFAQMKHMLGLRLVEFTQQIKNLYRNEGNFEKALALAQDYNKNGIRDLIDALAELCIEANDWKNLIKVFLSYKSDEKAIFELANKMYTSPEYSGFSDDPTGRERLKIAMCLFSLCPNDLMAFSLKCKIFLNLAGEFEFDSDSPLKTLFSLPGEALCLMADILYAKNNLLSTKDKTIAKLTKQMADLKKSAPEETHPTASLWMQSLNDKSFEKTSNADENQSLL